MADKTLKEIQELHEKRMAIINQICGMTENKNLTDADVAEAHKLLESLKSKSLSYHN